MLVLFAKANQKRNSKAVHSNNKAIQSNNKTKQNMCITTYIIVKFHSEIKNTFVDTNIADTYQNTFPISLSLTQYHMTLLRQDYIRTSFNIQYHIEYCT